MPATVTTSPTAVRRWENRYSTGWASRSAAMGGTREARMAGTTDEASVVSRPTTSAAMTVRGSSCVDVVGSEMPKPRSSPCRPRAMRNPKPRPIADATNPTMAASPRTERRTCRGLAPIARSSASSRVRCAIRIENVLKMVNAPTKIATPANTSRAMLKKERPFLI